MNDADLQKLIDFLGFTPGQKEVGLVVAADQTEIEEMMAVLSLQGFTQSPSIAGLFESPKAYMAIDSANMKNAYDLSAQYPTGQIEIFDDNLMQSLNFVPDYSKQAVLLLMTKAVLKLAEERGLDFRQAAGLTYQS